jgi:hypothetical protein
MPDLDAIKTETKRLLSEGVWKSWLPLNPETRRCIRSLLLYECG